MGISDDEIVALYDQLKKMRAPFVNEAMKIQKVVDNEIRLPLPEVDKVDESAVANLALQGVDAYGQRISSTIPDVSFLTQTLTGIGRERARNRSDLVEFWWDESMLDVLLGKLGRHFPAYGAAMLMVKPDFKKQMPTYSVVDPIDTLPVGDDVRPPACIHVHRKPRLWVHQNYGADKLPAARPRADDEIELLEYMDDAEIVVLAKQLATDVRQVRDLTSGYKRLRTTPNFAGVCPLVAVGRPGLTKPTSQFSGTLGMYVQRAMLQAYDLMGQRMSVMPRTWVVGRANETPSILKMPNPMTGEPGMVTGGQIEQLFPQPSQQLPIAIDRLERAERMQNGVVPEMGGEGATNIRTGRRGDQIMSATVDFPVQEAQRQLGRLLREANKVAIATDKGYWKGETKKFWVFRQESEEEITYQPDALWTTDRHQVSYAHPGADVNGLIVGIGQSIGLDLMSHRTGMKMHPMIEDAQYEHDQIVFEKLETVGLNVLEQQTMQGAVQWTDMVRIMQRVRMDNEELIPALVAQQAEAQARQSVQTPGPPIPGNEPGIGAGPPLPEESVAAEPQGLGNLGQLLRNLRLPSSAQAPGLPPAALTSGGQ